VTSDDAPIRTASELYALWQKLMGRGGFGQRTLWLIFLDGENRPVKVIIPVEGIPVEPDEVVLDNLALALDEARQEFGACTVPALLSRPGHHAMTDADRRWAIEIRRRLARHLGPWPVHLATCNRIQVFAPDDLIAAS
jgi:hypothetical protein